MTLQAIINREAGDKAKGPRLQRLRCVSLVLDAIEKCEKPHIYAAVEHKEDVFVKDITEPKDYLEQNKNYDEESSFTFNSPEIINTMVGFCDMWVEYIIKSKDVYLGFYTTNTWGKESKTGEVKSLGIELPNKPILELLQLSDLSYPNLLPAVKALIISEYKNQYKGKKGNGNINNLEAFFDEDWKKFLNRIDWKFGAIDEEGTQKEVLDKIKKCKLYNHTHANKEETILRNLMDLLDERQCVDDVLGKFVNVSDVKLIYIQAGSLPEVHKSDDPIYKIWDSYPPPLDKRNITDKIQAVCLSFETSRRNSYARKTAASRILQDERSSDKSFSSLRYRIFEKCADELDKYLQTTPAANLNTTEEIDKLFNFLFTAAKNYIASMSTDFTYVLRSDPVIEGVVLELFDSCYLALN